MTPSQRRRLARDLVIGAAHFKGGLPTATIAEAFEVTQKLVQDVVARIRHLEAGDAKEFAPQFSCPTYSEAFRGAKPRRRNSRPVDPDN